MANNQLLASDNFASGSLAAGWSLADGLTNTCQVISGSPNVTEARALSESDGQIWTGIIWPLDQISEVTINALTAESGSVITLLARWQSATVSGYEAALTNNTFSLFTVTGGTKTQLGSTVSGLTIAAGDIWSFHAEGAALSVYQNFKLIFQIADTSYLNWAANGSPGYYQFSSVNLAHSQVSSWRGYNAVTQDGIWQKQGIVIPALASDFTGGGTGTATPSQVLYEGNAQILSGNVYKIWFCGQQPEGSGGGNIGYAESLDGITWTRYSPYVLNGYISPTVWKLGSTYYMFAQPSSGLGTADYAVLTSTNGISWTLQNSSGVGLGTSGAWDASRIFGCGVVAIISGTWYALYYASGASPSPPSTGLATSTDGINWTKYAGNPVVTDYGMQQAVYTADNSTFYLWGAKTNVGRGGPDAYDPAEGNRYTVTNNFTTWVNRTPGLHNTQGYELVNTTIGQTWLGGVINVAGKTYGYTTSGNDGSAPLLYQISLVTAPAPLSSIVRFNEDAVQQIASDSFTRGAGPLGSNWTTLTGFLALQIVSGNLVEASALATNCGEVYTGASFSANQYSEITIQAISSANTLSPYVRGSVSTGFGYYCTLEGPAGTADTTANILRFSSTSGQMGPSTQITVQVGDVIRLQAVNGSDGFPVLSLFQNGFLILQVQDQSSAAVMSGNPGIYIDVTGALTNSQVSLWAGGNANVIPAYPSGASSSWLTVALANSLRGVRH